MFGFLRPAPQEPSGVDTMLGPGSEFKGPLKVRGTVFIDGRLDGPVTASDNILMGENASVKGDLRGRSVTVGGRVTGDVIADERIELLNTATVKGDLKAPRIIVGEGAYFEGSVHMVQARPEAAPAQPATPEGAPDPAPPARPARGRKAEA